MMAISSAEHGNARSGLPPVLCKLLASLAAMFKYLIIMCTTSAHAICNLQGMATTNEHGLLRLGMQLQTRRLSLGVHLSISPAHSAAVGLVSMFSLP